MVLSGKFFSPAAPRKLALRAAARSVVTNLGFHCGASSCAHFSDNDSSAHPRAAEAVNSPFTASRFQALGLARERSLRTPLALAGTHSDGLQVGAASGASLPLLGVVQGVWPPFQPSPHLHTHHRHSPPPPLPTPPFARSCPRIARLDPSADGARIPARLAGAAPPMAPPPAPRPPSAAPPSARSVGRRGRRMHARPSPRAGVAASPPARLLPRWKGVFARAFRVPQASVGPVRWRWRASARMSCIVAGTCET